MKTSKKKSKAGSSLTIPALPTKTPIKTATCHKSQGIILFDEPTLQDLYIKSGPLAPSCEFQTHFWSLVIRYKAEDNSILDICIPTCFYNYAQEVSGAHIDFTMDDVKAMAEKVQPIHNMKVNQLLSSPLVEYITKSLPSHELLSVPMNSLHKHPGSSSYQRFSTTDLNTNPDDLGIVFPLHQADNDYPTFAGIMVIEHNNNKLAHCEYRTVNGTLGTDILYTQHRCVAIVAGKQTPLSLVEQFCGLKPQDTSYYLLKDGIEDKEYINTLLSLYKQSNYSPSTDVVIPENLTQKSYTNFFTKSKKTTYTRKELLDMTYTQLEKLAIANNIVIDDKKRLNFFELVDILADELAEKTTPYQKQYPISLLELSTFSQLANIANITKMPIKTTGNKYTYQELKDAVIAHIHPASVTSELPIQPKSETDIAGLSDTELLQYMLDLEKIYYGKTDDTIDSLRRLYGSDLSFRIQITADILELQELIIDEASSPFYYED